MLQNGEINRRLPIHTHDIALYLRGIRRLADVGHEHRGIPDRLQREPIDVRQRLDLAIGIQVVIVRPDLHIPCRQDQVRLVDGAHDVHDAQLVCLELQRVDIHHDLPILAAEGLRYRRARHIGDLIADVVLTQVAQLRLLEPLPLQSHQAYRQTGGVEFQHHRRQRARRQFAQVRSRQIGDLGHRRIGIESRLEVDFDEADAGK